MKSKFEKLWNIVQKRINNNRKYKVPCLVATPGKQSEIILDYENCTIYLYFMCLNEIGARSRVKRLLY